jgi:hypothetical protein
MAQEHVNLCEECSREIQALDQLVAGLKANKDVFCPAPHALFDFVETGADPEGKLARHIDRCSLCQEDVAAYRAGCEGGALPEKVHAAYRGRFPQSTPRQLDVAPKNPFSVLSDWLSSLFRAPAFALATAAAAILVVVLIYPRGEIEPLIGLSSVAWKQAEDDFGSKSLLTPAKRFRVAVILLFKGFKEQWPQEKVDSLYEALHPPEEAFERFEFLNPADVRAALKGKMVARDAGGSTAEIAGKVGADIVVFLDVISKRDGFRVEGLAVHAETGKTIDTRAGEEIAEPQLPLNLREVLATLLGSGRSAP